MKTRPLVLTLVLLIAGCAPRYYKGNLHTHSLWSDGTDFPEMIAAWYKEQGYDFLAVTEHNVLQHGEKWVDIAAKDEGWPPRNQSTQRALPGYRQRFGDAWVQEKRDGEKHLIRLRALDEYCDQFEEKGRFLFIPGEEITDRQGVHINVFNLTSLIMPRGGANAAERARNNLAAVEEQKALSSQPILAIVNHPNYVWALNAEDIALIPQLQMFEVYNGHRGTNNEGDEHHHSTEEFWDIVLSMRLERGMRPVYGVAADDAHDYREYSDTVARPGRAWVMVRSGALTPAALLTALGRGEFYSSTGVAIRGTHVDRKKLRIDINAEPGVTYTTRFVGTRKGSTAKGETLAEVTGAKPEYHFKGDERYVRAKIVSSRAHLDPIGGKRLGQQAAWIQPVLR